MKKAANSELNEQRVLGLETLKYEDDTNSNHGEDFDDDAHTDDQKGVEIEDNGEGSKQEDR